MPKLLELYERVSQRKELEAAGLENLEECPFCEYQVVIENEHEKLFRCEREECGAVSCRKCKKPVSKACAVRSYWYLIGYAPGSPAEELRGYASGHVVQRLMADGSLQRPWKTRSLTLAMLLRKL